MKTNGRIVLPLALILLTPLGVYSLYDASDLGLYKQMDISSIVFLSALFVGCAVYGFALHWIGDRSRWTISPKMYRRLIASGQIIRAVSICAGAYIGCFFLAGFALRRFPDSISLDWLDLDYLLLPIGLFQIALVVLAVGCLMLGLIRASLQAFDRNRIDRQGI
jgi:hypothetical protein